MSDDARYAALLARFDQSIEASIAATVADAAKLDDLDATTAIGVMFEATMASPHTRETLAMAYAQLSIRLRRTISGATQPGSGATQPGDSATRDGERRG